MRRHACPRQPPTRCLARAPLQLELNTFIDDIMLGPYSLLDAEHLDEVGGSTHAGRLGPSENLPAARRHAWPRHPTRRARHPPAAQPWPPHPTPPPPAPPATTRPTPPHLHRHHQAQRPDPQVHADVHGQVGAPHGRHLQDAGVLGGVVHLQDRGRARGGSRLKPRMPRVQLSSVVHLRGRGRELRGSRTLSCGVAAVVQGQHAARVA